MSKFAVVKTGGKQYLVKENDEIFVDKLQINGRKKIDLKTLARIDSEKETVELGSPVLKEKVRGELLQNVKGDKIHIARFKAKVRYRKVKGFRSQLSKIKILKI